MKKNLWTDFFTDNFSYKVVALFIALILWLTILGRRDFILTKNMDVEVVVKSGYSLPYQSQDQVKIKITGPRAALKKFIDSGINQVLTLDLSDLDEGEHEIQIPKEKIDVPFGVKVLSTRPESIKVKISKK